MIQDAKVTMSEATEMTVHPTCPFCGDTTSVVVDAAGFVAWQSGELVQNALPNLSADDREVLISGICTDCWDKQFPADED
jgi:hypothetical protein